MQVAGPGSLDVAHRVIGVHPGYSLHLRQFVCKEQHVGSIKSWCCRQPLKVDDSIEILARPRSEASANHLRVKAPRAGWPAQDHRFDLGHVDSLPKDRDIDDDLGVAATKSGDDAIAIGMRAPDRLRLQPNDWNWSASARADAIVGVKPIVRRLRISSWIDSAMLDRWSTYRPPQFRGDVVAGHHLAPPEIGSDAQSDRLGPSQPAIQDCIE